MDASSPAGWYPDPGDLTRQRYWDGAHWAALTQPPVITVRHQESAPLGSPGNPIGAGSVALAAALHSLTTTAYDTPIPEPEPAGPRRRRWRR